MHRYNNKANYGFTSVRSEFKSYEPEPVYMEPMQPMEIQKPKNRYLPGERLLKKLNQQEQKKKPLNMKVIEQSISEILDSL